MIDTFPFSSHFFKWGCSGLNFYVHGKSVDGMDVQGISVDFSWIPNLSVREIAVGL